MTMVFPSVKTLQKFIGYKVIMVGEVMVMVVMVMVVIHMVGMVMVGVVLVVGVEVVVGVTPMITGYLLDPIGMDTNALFSTIIIVITIGYGAAAATIMSNEER